MNLKQVKQILYTTSGTIQLSLCRHVSGQVSQNLRNETLLLWQEWIFIIYPSNLQESTTALCPMMDKQGRSLDNLSSLSAVSSYHKLGHIIERQDKHTVWILRAYFSNFKAICRWPTSHPLPLDVQTRQITW